MPNRRILTITPSSAMWKEVGQDEIEILDLNTKRKIFLYDNYSFFWKLINN